MLEVLGERPIALARELTKLHEEFLRGSCSEVLAALRARAQVQGEITVVLGAAPRVEPAAESGLPLRTRVDQLMREEHLSRMEALKKTARERRVSKRQAYQEYLSGTKGVA
jgi:16S rRNA (cytidine1402-2'-O)-methyltransferase